MSPEAVAAEFPGTCNTCGTEWLVDEKIVRAFEPGAWQHEECQAVIGGTEIRRHHDLGDQMEPVVHSVAKGLARRFSSVTTLDDAYQQSVLWVLSNPRDVKRIQNKYGETWRAVLANAIWRAGVSYCKDLEQQTRTPSQLDPTARQAQDAYAALSEDDRWLVEQIHLHKRTQTDIAKELGVSQPRISQRWDSIIQKLRASAAA